VSLARFNAAALAAALTSAPLSAASQDAAQGRLKAQPCSVCHGPLGISMVPDAPHLAGQPAIYLAAQLRLYRSGERKHEVMSVMARGLSDDDIAHLAAWFASIRVEAKPPG
jgi:cytochrome c553